MLFTPLQITLISLAVAWTLPWTGISLWKAARRKDYAWFVILLLVHTLGILDIIYIFAVSKKKAEG